MNSNIDALRSYVEKIIKKERDNSNNNIITTTGTIIESLPGYYNVKLQDATGSTVKATSFKENSSYKKGDYVFLIGGMISDGNYSGVQYQIFNLVSFVEFEFSTESLIERFKAFQEAFLKTDISQKIFSDSINKEEIKIISISSTEGDYQKLLETDNLIKSFLVSGLFSVNVTSVGDKPDFGLRLEVTYEDDEKEEHVFGTGYFTGQPFKLNNSYQSFVYELKKNKKIVGLEIYLFKEGFEGTISFSNLYIEAGDISALLDNLELSIKVEGKDFFYKDDKDDIVVLKANANYNGQELDASSLQYYWFLEKEADEYEILLPPEINGYEGWICLNDYNIVKNEEGNDLVIWNSSSPELKLKSDYLIKYKNKIKCVLKYNREWAAASNILEIRNFTYEQFDVTIVSDSLNQLLVKASDRIMLTAKVTEENNPVVNSQVTYEWYKKVGDTDTKLMEESKAYSKSTLVIRDENNTTDFGFINNEYEIDVNEVSFYCKIYKDDTLVGTSNSITVSSIVHDNTLVEDIKEWYYISSNPNVSFIYIFTGEDENDRKDNSKYDWQINDTTNENVSWTENQNLDLSTKPKEVFKKEPIIGDKQYLYYISQKYIYKGTIEENNLITIEQKIKPIIKYGAECREEKTWTYFSDVLIEQLNTFNSLTKSGEDQGIYFDDEVFILATEFNSQKTYYKKDFIKHTGLTAFEPKIDYYELVPNTSPEEYVKTTDINPQKEKTYYTLDYVVDNDVSIDNFESKKSSLYIKDGTNLYINASYIRSGTLEVADPAGNQVFFASLEDPIVKIAGFNVDGTSIKSKNGFISLVNNGDSQIAGFNINQHSFFIKDDENKFTGITTLDSKSDGTRFFAGASDDKGNEANFSVTQSGTVYLKSAIFANGALIVDNSGIHSKDKKFSISTEGDVTLSGDILINPSEELKASLAIGTKNISSSENYAYINTTQANYFYLSTMATQNSVNPWTNTEANDNFSKTKPESYNFPGYYKRIGSFSSSNNTSPIYVPVIGEPPDEDTYYPTSSNGDYTKLIINTSKFKLDLNGSVWMEGTINATGGEINGILNLNDNGKLIKTKNDITIFELSNNNMIMCLDDYEYRISNNGINIYNYFVPPVSGYSNPQITIVPNEVTDYTGRGFDMYGSLLSRGLFTRTSLDICLDLRRGWVNKKGTRIPQIITVKLDDIQIEGNAIKATKGRNWLFAKDVFGEGYTWNMFTVLGVFIAGVHPQSNYSLTKPSKEDNPDDTTGTKGTMTLGTNSGRGAFLSHYITASGNVLYITSHWEQLNGDYTICILVGPHDYNF